MTNNTQPVCPICGEGRLHALVLTNEVEYKGQHASLPLLMTECDVCGIEQADSEEARANKRAMLAFRKQVDGLLSGTEIRALRDHFDINQAQAARIFGGGPVAFSKYENDDVAQSESMDKLIRVAKAVPAAFCWLANTAGEKQAALKVQMQEFMQWRNSVTHLVPSTYQHEPVSTHSKSSISSFAMTSSANDRRYHTDLELAAG